MLITNRFYINGIDKYIYIKIEDNKCVIICLYVNKILISGTNLNVVYETKKFLGSKFNMKDL